MVRASRLQLDCVGVGIGINERTRHAVTVLRSLGTIFFHPSSGRLRNPYAFGSEL